MANPTINGAVAIQANDNIVDALDVGTINPSARIQIYDNSGPQPADPDAPVGTAVLLAELEMSNPAFGASVDLAPGARATANAIADDASANAAGTASWFRVVNRDGNGVIDGDVTVTGGGGDMELNSIIFSVGATVSVTVFTFDHRQTP